MAVNLTGLPFIIIPRMGLHKYEVSFKSKPFELTFSQAASNLSWSSSSCGSI